MGVLCLMVLLVQDRAIDDAIIDVEPKAPCCSAVKDWPTLVPRLIGAGAPLPLETSPTAPETGG